MPVIRAVDASVLLAPTPTPSTKKALDPELAQMVAKISTIKDESVVYEVSLDEGEKASTVRQRLLRAAKVAGVEVAVRKSPKGWYIGLMTPERRSKQGRKKKVA